MPRRSVASYTADEPEKLHGLAFDPKSLPHRVPAAKRIPQGFHLTALGWPAQRGLPRETVPLARNSNGVLSRDAFHARPARTLSLRHACEVGQPRSPFKPKRLASRPAPASSPARQAGRGLGGDDSDGWRSAGRGTAWFALRRGGCSVGTSKAVPTFRLPGNLRKLRAKGNAERLGKILEKGDPF